MEAQEIFDTIVNHLRNQNAKSTYHSEDPDETDPSCAYRGVDGMQCAIGCLLTDAEYAQIHEGMSVRSIITSVPSFKSRYGNHARMLVLFQSLHDEAVITSWEAQFKLIAHTFHVNYTPAN
jgi:hypothetical protein